MDENLRGQIRGNFENFETDDLMKIWKLHNTDEWTEDAFTILREVLFERGGNVPDISTLPPLHQIIERIKDLRNQKAYSSALAECERAINLVPDKPNIQYYLGLTYQDLGELEKALASFRKAFELAPELEEAGKRIEVLEREIDHHFENSLAQDHLDQAMIYAEDEEWDNALREIDLAKDDLPELATAYTAYGLALTAVKQFDEAIEAFRKAIQLNPNYSDARTGLRNARVKQEEEQILADITAEPVDNVEVDRLSAEFDDKEFEKNQNELEDTPGWVYMNKDAQLVGGSTGYRNRPGRSGYDPLDTRFDEARFEGGLIRRLLTGHMRTKDPLYLLGMTIVGFIFCIPTVYIIGSMTESSMVQYSPILFLLFPAAIPGPALLINVGLSLISEEPDEIRRGGGKYF
jgi:tetratricopeptide (TPR) repeat protein